MGVSGTAQYDGFADWYDTQFQPAPLESETWKTLVGLLGDGPGALIDVGCGTGAYATGLTEQGWDVTGVDVSEDMLRRARAKGVDAVHADATALPFDEAMFDAAISVFTHTDVDDFPAIVQEIARVKQARQDFVTVVPGVRLAEGDVHDQARVGTPSQVAAAGADVLVIGRTVSAADDRRAAAQRVHDVVADALVRLRV